MVEGEEPMPVPPETEYVPFRKVREWQLSRVPNAVTLRKPVGEEEKNVRFEREPQEMPDDGLVMAFEPIKSIRTVLAVIVVGEVMLRESKITEISELAIWMKLLELVPVMRSDEMSEKGTAPIAENGV